MMKALVLDVDSDSNLHNNQLNVLNIALTFKVFNK